MLYTAKCYWPGVSAAEFDRVASRLLRPTRRRSGPAYLGSLLFPADDLVLCLFDGSSRRAVKQMAERAGFPCERIIDSVWVAATPVEAIDLEPPQRPGKTQ
jgi:Protein of unknown function (DUF4242)